MKLVKFSRTTISKNIYEQLLLKLSNDCTWSCSYNNNFVWQIYVPQQMFFRPPLGGWGGWGVIKIPTVWLLRNFRWSTFVLAKLGHPSSTFIYWSWDSWFLQKIFKDAGGLTCSLKVMMDLWQKTTALRFWAVRVKQETLWKCQHQLAKKNSSFQKNLLVAAS